MDNEDVKQQTDPAQESEPFKRIKILLVEDSPNINLLYKRGLPDMIFIKSFASNGHDALVTYHEWHPDIIILDVMLPVMSGYSVLKDIRNKFLDKTTTIIMSTSLSKKEDVTLMLKQGVQGYIIKPFSIRDIGGKILKYFEKIDPVRAADALALLDQHLENLIKAIMQKEYPAKEPAKNKETKPEEKKEEINENKEKTDNSGKKKRLKRLRREGRIFQIRACTDDERVTGVVDSAA